MPLSEVILIIMGLLTLALIVAGLCRNLPVPYSVMLVVIGLMLGWLARAQPQYDFLLEFQLTPERVLFLFLPALIFESAFNLDARALLKELTPVITLAIPALLLSSLLIGLGLWLLLDMNLGLALLFGALISATDPVAVISLFREIGAPQRLTVLVEGESLFNDATAIVLFNTVLVLVLAGSVSVAAIGYAGLDFLRVFLGGIMVGVSLGLLVSMLLNRLHAGRSAYLIMSLVIPYSSFIIAEHFLHLSGVMAVVGAALIFAAYGVARIPQESTQTLHDMWEVIAVISNALLFLLVGFSIDITSLSVSADMIIVAVLLMLLARALTIYGFLPATIRFFQLPHVNMAERHVMWWGGLKGGLAIAIALTLPENLPGREIVLDLTLAVVLFSLLINAPTVRPLIIWLGIDRLTPDEHAELQYSQRGAMQQAKQVLEKVDQAGMLDKDIRGKLDNQLAGLFGNESLDLNRQQQQRRLQALTLQAEMEILLHLYRINLIRPYTFLDLRNILRRDREAMDAGDGSVSRVPGLFERIEALIVRWLREQNRAAPLLAWYQSIRLEQRLQRDVAAILMADAALAVIADDQDCDPEARQNLAGLYEQRRQRRCQRLQDIASEYPRYYECSILRLTLQAALTAAREAAEEDHHHAAIGAKAFVTLDRLIYDALHDLPIVPQPEIVKLGAVIERVPLLQGLSERVSERLQELANTVTFLPGDTVIAEGQHGDALYIILSGTVAVTRQDNNQTVHLARLSRGNFFGETALLGQHVRTASIRAETPLTLLRLSCREVLKIAETEPELRSRLESASVERSAEPGENKDNKQSLI